ncbi:MAG: NADH-quinone oxidoreductase subunit L [Candidatus Lambdaproteobacteria bacterium]|nr:NADH-quinone oxidoreductase subunit L [Candidatus Lambdaproteobacteria bacterium]
MVDHLWLIPALPLLGFLLNGLLGKTFGKRFVSLVGPGVVGLSFLLSILAFREMLGAPEYSISQLAFTWLEAGNFYVPVEFTVDRLSGLYILIVTGVGFLIHVYSVGYMGEEQGYYRYFAFLNLFIFFMLLLVLGSSFLLLFVGWEGVGLCSYLLIGFSFERDSAAKAAKKAFVVNRIGDFGMIVATLMIFVIFGTLDFAYVTQRAPALLEYGGFAVTALTLCLFLAATGKSAQIPLYTWLPDAMEGPTPVSALIHAATMVTAGLYMLARLSALFVLAPVTMGVIVVVATATAFFAATVGLAQNDIKKVLAYSTVSQLGYMFMAMGVGAFMAGIFHVMTHAFFKALLFLGSGSVIHAMHHEQDMTKMGGLRARMPITALTYIVGALAISGFPFFFAGFFSKDEILWQVFSSAAGHPVVWVVGAITAVLTAFYMFRTVALTFFGKSRVDPHHAPHVHESPWTMTLPLVVLAVLSVIGGWVGIPHVLGGPLGLHNVMEGYFEGFFARVPAEAAYHGVTVELLLMGLSTGLALIAMYASYRLFAHQPERAAALKARLSVAHRVLANKYYIDELYDLVFVRPIHWISDKILWRIVDVRIIDAIVNGVGITARNLGGALRLAQNGVVENYAIGIALGAVVIIWYLVF